MNILSKRTALTLLTLFFAIGLMAQELTVKGTVTMKADGETYVGVMPAKD